MVFFSAVFAARAPAMGKMCIRDRHFPYAAGGRKRLQDRIGAEPAGHSLSAGIQEEQRPALREKGLFGQDRLQMVGYHQMCIRDRIRINRKETSILRWDWINALATTQFPSMTVSLPVPISIMLLIGKR